ncbi:hypothetical protein LTR84_007761 [Exophiala bonariae]|uniref:Zn(2)-C6 fungal-type domain-containing protein n=1 Tax=Exophiala bonariae TaxID=1690606 RepID=A0AAV9NPK9_9EURO|nr:hypothetical protein LTR84_007761 [Exophiala bonariae]
MARARISKPKVRSGCFTCKSRRVKCDEAKPVCLRCIRAGRECAGYPDSLSYRLQVAPANDSISTYNIPFKVPGSQADRQLLHYYCSQVALSLASYSDPSLWTELILQRCHHQPVVRNALVALSSLHKDFQCEAPPVVDELKRAHRLVASPASLTMIAKSHRQLARYLSRPDASADVALICSVIYFICEALLGDSQQAIWHLDRGLVLLKRSQLSGNFDATSSDDPLVPRLTSLFEQLDCQACTFDDQRAPILVLSPPPELNDRASIVPEQILDLGHAELILIKLQNRVFHHLVSSVIFKGKPLKDLPQSLIQERLLLVADLQHYGDLLDVFAEWVGYSTESPPSHSGGFDERSRQQWKRYLLLRINYHTFYHLIKDCSMDFSLNTGVPSAPTSEMIANIKSDLEMDLKIASDAVSWILPRTTTPQRTYTLSSHLIAVIYFVGAKTTSATTRHKAFELLAHPSLSHSRDGLWDAQTASFFLTKMTRKIRRGPTLISLTTSGMQSKYDESSVQHPDQLPIANCKGWSINLALSIRRSRRCPRPD